MKLGSREFLSVALAFAIACAAGPSDAAPRKPSRERQRMAVAKARASILQRNVIANGDAELEEDGFASGWEPREILQSESYGHTNGEWSSGVNSGPGARERYFRLPVPDGHESIDVEQWIRVGGDSMLVDSGVLSYTLSGAFGGLVDGAGTTVLAVTFLDAEGRELARAATAPVLPADLPRPETGSASLLRRSIEGTVPAGARRLHVTLSARHLNLAECPNCGALGLADQLSLVLARPRPRQP